MAIYREIVNNIGRNLSDYKSGAWELFINQMATDVRSQFLFSNGKRADESLLDYSYPYIEEYNRKVRGNGKFTYYTSKDGPNSNLYGNPILPDPSSSLNITEELNINTRDNAGLNVISEEMTKRTVGEYTEGNKFSGGTDRVPLDNIIYEPISTDGNTLLGKTKKWFSDNSDGYIKKRFSDNSDGYIKKRFSTLISRFHTDDEQITQNEIKNSVALQAGTTYGLSHGNNLLKKKSERENSKVNGYDDPYCRVWTWHKQYSMFVRDTIRPFSGETENDKWSVFRSYNSDAGENFPNGGKRLSEYGVMYDNDGKTYGLVNITPSYKKISEAEISEAVNIKHCMFSIENLAWKGKFTDFDGYDSKYGLSPEQKGPLGGRIMWFPPYDLKFSEDTSANWQSNEFIGRGEPIYTYANTTRSGSLSFKLLIDHPSILDYWEGKYKNNESSSDFSDSAEQELLRFFAGCEVLSAKELPKLSDYNPYSEPQNNDGSERRNYEEVANGEPNKLNFFVFFPNNYSGVDDLNSGVVDPIEYLINGIGAQKCFNGNDEIVDFKTNMTAKYTYNGESVGGYEMCDSYGISVVEEATSSNTICVVYEGKKEITLAKMFDNHAEMTNGPKTNSDSDKKNWNLCRYYYRCDNAELGDKFMSTDDNNAASYIDKTSYGLNREFKDNHVFESLIKEYNCHAWDTYSLLEIYGVTNGYVSFNIDKDKYDILKKVLKEKTKGKIVKIIVSGRASSQGDRIQNMRLAKNRAKTVEYWLRHSLNLSNDVKFEVTTSVDEDTSYKSNSSNIIDAKLNRHVFVQIQYNNGETSNASETSFVSGDTSIITQSDPNSNNLEENETEIITNDEEMDYKRYDSEALFFKQLTKEDPFITKQISDRIKNFDPVFHSMSPEGFNARLTFLNQCMRQGPTISWSDNKNKYNANNMAFGRPPVCVLRVGDFYNTKIIINTLNISYDPLQWDLNSEGIGVMPMIANVTINFNFIGGSDLGGPIERLQNATSFNYYANTGVYDNRSEMIKHDGLDRTFFKASPM